MSIVQMYIDFNLLVLACMGQTTNDRSRIMGISHFDCVSFGQKKKGVKLITNFISCICLSL